MAVNFQSIFDKNQFFLDQVAGKSKGWFFKEVDKLTNQRITPGALLRDNANKATKRIVPGNMYMYVYDPKHKDTLPYYDKFPLVFPFRSLKTGFIGLNMHYLPYDGRIKLFQALTTVQSSKVYDERTKLRLSWEVIQGLSQFKLAQPCVKQYLYSHIRSEMVKVDSYHWITALMMPVERFAKSNKIGVWMDSR